MSAVVAVWELSWRSPRRGVRRYDPKFEIDACGVGAIVQTRPANRAVLTLLKAGGAVRQRELLVMPIVVRTI